MISFAWDSRKEADNVRKHGVSFHEASKVFCDPLSLTFPDPDHSAGECRYITLGLSVDSRLLFVAHVDRGDVIRIISAREATRRERRGYEEQDR